MQDSVAGWVSVGASSAILFVGVGYPNTFGVFESFYQDTLLKDVPPEKIVLIGSIAASLYFILGAFTGRLADIIGYRWNIIIGAGWMTGGMFGASASQEYWQLFLTQGVMFGLGVAFVYPPATAISRQYFTKHGLANGIVVSGGALGGAILPDFTRKMLKNLGLPATFRILGFLALGILIPSTAIIKPKPQERKAKALLDWQTLSNPQFWCLTIACVIAMTGFLPRYFLLPSSAISKGVDPSYASWLLGIMNALSIFGRIGIGMVADRFGPLQALTASFILCSVGHFAFWLPSMTVEKTSTATGLFTTFVVFTGIMGSGFISLFPVVVAHLFGRENLASKTGLLNSLVGLAVFTGPSAIYAIVGKGSEKEWIIGILTAGIFMLIGGLVLEVFSLAARPAQASTQEIVLEERRPTE